MQKIKNFFQLLKAAGTRWAADKASVLAAALAFYTGLALAPLLIVMVVLAGIFLNGEAVQATIIEQVAATAGADAAELIASMLEGGFDPSAGAIAAVISLVSIFFSASGLFAQLQNAFNMIWRESAEPRKGILGFLLTRLRALVMVLSIGFLLILTVALSTVFSAATAFVKESPEIIAREFPAVSLTLLNTIVDAVLPIIDITLSIVLLTFVFGWMFRSVPSVKLHSRDVRAGALLTAILFWLGKYGLAFYLSRGSVGSAYGAAGSLLVLLVFVYYSAQIMLFGAEYTYVDATTYGSLVDEADDSPTTAQAT